MDMSDIYIPADYAVDGLSLEAERRSKALGRPYSYGQLIADTTPQEREVIAENYQKELVKAQKRGRFRVSGGAFLMPERSGREVEERVLERLSESLAEEAQ